MEPRRVASTAFGDKEPPIDPVGVAERGTSEGNLRPEVPNAAPDEFVTKNCLLRGGSDPAAAFWGRRGYFDSRLSLPTWTSRSHDAPAALPISAKMPPIMKWAAYGLRWMNIQAPHAPHIR